jgi:hypothetical protein
MGCTCDELEKKKTVKEQKAIIDSLRCVNNELLEKLDALEAVRPNKYEKELGHLPPPEDRRNMQGFVSGCIAACWAANYEMNRIITDDYCKRQYGEYVDADKYGARQMTKSWLYDAASVLEIVSHDGKLLSLLSEWYERDGGIPWSREGDWRKTDEC